nr:hypothetical protein BaRGS_006407 [Batillaria attramentaria]
MMMMMMMMMMILYYQRFDFSCPRVKVKAVTKEGKLPAKLGRFAQRYPELRTQLNNDYEQAVRHYLTHGLSEHRLGYVDGGFEGRWTVSDAKHRLFLSTSNRMGGAVDSLVWNHPQPHIGDIPQYHMAQIVAPSTHLTAGFTRVRSVDPDTGHLVTHSDHKPTIVSTTNDHYALGAFCPPGQDPDPFVYSIRNVGVQLP